MSALPVPTCDHHWHFTSQTSNSAGWATNYICCKCGEYRSQHYPFTSGGQQDRDTPGCGPHAPKVVRFG